MSLRDCLVTKNWLIMFVLLSSSGQLCALNAPVTPRIFNAINKLNTQDMRRGVFFGLTALGAGYLTKWCFGKACIIYRRTLQVGDLAELSQVRFARDHGDIEYEHCQHATPKGKILFASSSIATIASAAATVVCGLKSLEHFYKAC